MAAMTRRTMLNGILVALVAKSSSARIMNSMLGAKNSLIENEPDILNPDKMTILNINATSSNLTYGMRQGVLADKSKFVRVYWDMLGNIDDYDDFIGGFDHAYHTYDKPGNYVVGISDDIKQLSLLVEVEL